MINIDVLDIPDTSPPVRPVYLVPLDVNPHLVNFLLSYGVRIVNRLEDAQAWEDAGSPVLLVDEEGLELLAASFSTVPPRQHPIQFPPPYPDDPDDSDDSED